MPHLIGIDVGASRVRIARLRTSHRRILVEQLLEVPRAGESLSSVIGSALAREPRVDAVAVAIDGLAAYLHRLTLPPAALKQVTEVLPFELEAQIPVEFSELVYDARVLPRGKHQANIEVIAAAARIADVRLLLDEVRTATGQEPQRVGVGPFPLANLAALLPELRSGCVAVVDIGDSRTEVLVLVQGGIAFGRTLSVGVGGLPASGPELVAAFKQTLVAWNALSETPIEAIYLAGGGALAVGMAEYLSAWLGVQVAELPHPPLEHADGDTSSWLRFATAIGIALSLRTGAKDLDLRRGGLAYQRGYSFLRERLPLAAGVGAATLVSFLFATWAEGRSLAGENAALADTLSAMSKELLGEESGDPEHVLELLDTGDKATKDPQPEVDAFDLCVALAESVPQDVPHDVDELDLQRNHVILRGLVKEAEAAQHVSDNLKKHPCIRDLKIAKITQEVKGPGQKYTMEFDLACAGEKDTKGTPPPAAGAKE